MPIRLAACEPCRDSKLACDHARPFCSRCKDNGKTSQCIYRQKPFKRIRRRGQAVGNHSTLRGTRASSQPAEGTAPPNHPNPGYLGISSHATIYDQLDSSGDTRANIRHFVTHGQRGSFDRAVFGQTDVTHGVRLLCDIGEVRIELCKQLVDKWIAAGVNMALAEPFMKCCIVSTTDFLLENSRALPDARQRSLKLFTNSLASLPESLETTIEQYTNTFCNDSIRWETVGLFFAAICRATFDVAYLEPLYTAREERMTLQRLAAYVVKCCLEIALDLDCLNDLQLVLQYEAFIIYSHVYGDQSYHYWRKLGDVIGSLFALGYHEFTEETYSQMPGFLRDIRKTAFARVFSADKNVSIFLGRPPRMSRHYCRLAKRRGSGDGQNGTVAMVWPGEYQWPPAGGFVYQTESRWSAICAVLKEKALELYRLEDYNERAQHASDIEKEAEAIWAEVPDAFRITRPLKTHDRAPIELDFLVSAKLNYVQVLFLTKLALTRQMKNPHDELVDLAEEMMTRIVEALLLKTQLASSGTGLVWKVAHYGVPAAGILCLRLLQSLTHPNVITRPSVLQDLSVLVAEVERGSLLHPEDPNFPLLSGATRAINNILKQFLTKPAATSTRDDNLNPQDELSWYPQTTEPDYHDFELDFWLNLADHPTLTQTV